MTSNFDEYGPYSPDTFAYEMYPDEHLPMESGVSRRSSAEADNSGSAREHQLYQNAVVGPDGLYHCPWEGSKEAACTHKPEKLKCIYEYEPADTVAPP
jgi:hypothetical protein